MSFKIDSKDGYIAAIIFDDCSFERAYSIGKILTEDFHIAFTEKLQDLDSFYWDFNYKGSVLTLHYNTFVGLNIAPFALKNATDADNERTKEIGEVIFQHLTKIG